MIPIKIQCGCGQRYAFEIEAVNGRMPHAVACPVCGADGTGVANEYLAEFAPVAPQLAVRAAGGGGLHVAAAPGVRMAEQPAAAVHRPTLRPGQVDPDQARTEARAKIFWGDPQVEVVKFLMRQGFNHAEAAEMVGAMFLERAAAVRSLGIRKIITGIALICVPIAAWVGFMSIGFIPMKIFAVTVMVGLYGAWLLMKGTFMFVAPKSEPGDVADQ